MGKNGSPEFRTSGNEVRHGEVREVVTSDHSEHKSCRFYKGDGRGRALLPHSRAHPHHGRIQRVLLRLFTSPVPFSSPAPVSPWQPLVFSILQFFSLKFLYQILTLITTSLFPDFCFHGIQCSLNYLLFRLKQILLFIYYLKLIFTLLFHTCFQIFSFKVYYLFSFSFPQY